MGRDQTSIRCERAESTDAICIVSLSCVCDDELRDGYHIFDNGALPEEVEQAEAGVQLSVVIGGHLEDLDEHLNPALVALDAVAAELLETLDYVFLQPWRWGEWDDIPSFVFCERGGRMLNGDIAVIVVSEIRIDNLRNRFFDSSGHSGERDFFIERIVDCEGVREADTTKGVEGFVEGMSGASSRGDGVNAETV